MGGIRRSSKFERSFLKGCDVHVQIRGHSVDLIQNSVLFAEHLGPQVHGAILYSNWWDRCSVDVVGENKNGKLHF